MPVKESFKKPWRNNVTKALKEIAKPIKTSINVFKINIFLGGKGREKRFGIERKDGKITDLC